MRNYDNKAYAANRLAGTFVRHKGKAVEVVDIGVMVSALELISGELVVFPYEELDINPVPLGYANVGGKALYVSRIPLRNDWKQGARFKNLRWTSPADEPNEIEPELIDEAKRLNIDPVLLKRAQPRAERFDLPKKSLGELIEGKFPSFAEAIRAVQTGRKIVSIAWNRNFAVDKNLKIQHKGHIVGWFDAIDRRGYKLKDEYWWTKEALEESW